MTSPFTIEDCTVDPWPNIKQWISRHGNTIPCVLCGNRANRLGIFPPSDSFLERSGRPTGEERVVVAYGICPDCQTLDVDRSPLLRAIEEKILPKARVQ